MSNSTLVPRLQRLRSTSATDTGIVYRDLRRYTRRYSHDLQIEQTLNRYLHNEPNQVYGHQSRGGEDGLEVNSVATEKILGYILPKYSKRYKTLTSYLAKWKPEREALIFSFLSHAKELDDNWKSSTIVRLFSSSIDLSALLAQQIFHLQSRWWQQALIAASFCGLCGLFATVLEVEKSKRILQDVILGIESDQKQIMPIMNYFKEIKELDSVVQQIFPYGIDKKIVHEIEDASAEQDGYLKLFRAALCTNVRRDETLLHNEDFLHSLQIFARSEVAQVWWNSMFHRKHPILLDLQKITLQIEFKQLQNAVFQYVPALPLEQQKLTTLPVAGRMVLNLLTIYDSFYDFRKKSKSSHSDKLRRLCEKMKEEMEIVENTIAVLNPSTNELDYEIFES